VTDRIALVLALIIVTAVIADVALNGGHAMLFLLRKLEDLIEYLAVWR
jgi:hypothetical protein